MSKRKKVVKLIDLIAIVNKCNRESTCDARTRDGWNHLLGEVLLSTDNYAGFRYLSASEVPPNEKPGIAGECPAYRFPDQSRREYIVKPGLR